MSCHIPEIRMDSLLQQANRMVFVPEAVSALYLYHGEAMLEQVNNILLERPDLSELLGGNPQQMMFDNHRYHFEFMANVFEFQGYDMLVRTVPWVYRAYFNHGFSADYFVTELEAWVSVIKQILADEGNTIVAVYEFLLDNHEVFVDLAGQHAWDDKVPFFEDAQDAVFYDHLLEGNFAECFAIGRAFLERTGSLERLYLDIFQPAMYRIGRDWEMGRISVAKEHLASAVVMRLLASIYPLLDLPSVDKGTVLVTVAPNEYHEIGAWMVANTLELDGWKTVYLGANTPCADFMNLVRAEKPCLLAFSIAMPFNLRHLKRMIDQLESLSPAERPFIMVGGQVFRLGNRLQKTLGADAYADSCVTAAQTARGWWNKVQ
jgi:methanogenic corrinoid protein MtbC1